MSRVFDEADYRRRLDALDGSDLSLGQELAIAVQPGFKLDAVNAIRNAKIEALRQARREMIAAIRAAEDKARAGAVIPIDVQEIVTGNADDLVKVP